MSIATYTDLSEREASLQEEAREFAQQRLAPGAIERDREGVFCFELYKEAAEAGFIGVKIPEHLGGRGLGLFDECLVLEELAGGDPSFAFTISVSAGLCGGYLLQYGSDELKNLYIPPLTKGAIGAWAITERVAGSHAAVPECEARRTEDTYVINGAKMFVAQGVEFESAVILACTAEGKNGISAFLIEKDDEGRKSVACERALGMRSAGMTEMIFEDCVIPAGRLLGNEGEGLQQAMHVMGDGRVALGAICVGIAQASLDAAVTYMKKREAPGESPADFAGLRGLMADSAIDVATAREMIANAAKIRDAGRDNREEATMAELFASEACLRVCDRGIQIHGGYGYIAEAPAGMLWRDARMFPLGEGTGEVHRNLINRCLFDS